MLHFRVASLVGFIFSFPYLIIEIWFFIRPGLTKKERRFICLYIPLIFILFFLGIAFTYYILIPYYVMFSQKLAGNTDLNIVMGANKYIDFIGKMLLYFGLVFQLPILVLILSYIGILNAKLLKLIRKYAYFMLLVISAFITPPDPVSMGIALLPLAALYEVSIILCKLTERKRRKKSSTLIS
jgi:sec-independent protein translocase protein TatC